MSNQIRLGKRILLWVLVAITLLVAGLGWSVLAQEESWTTPVVVSEPEQISWFPDLAVDPFGSIHVVWCQTTPLERGGLQEQVNYNYWDGVNWLTPNDIVPSSADIVRNAIAADLMGNVHLIFGGSVYDRNLELYYQKAPGNEAWSAGAWDPPHRINQGTSYMGDIGLDSHNVIHVIYDDTVRYDEDELVQANISYRHSTDGGQTWSAPLSLHPEPLTGSARPYMEIDSSDVIHVTWDEGWDRLSGKGEPIYGVYTSSADGGETWSPATVIDYPDSTVAQLTVGSDGKGGVILVWRATMHAELFYQWSTDGGQSWTEPSTVPQVFTRPWTVPFDMYDTATDSDGHIHLLVVGRESQEKEAQLGIYHLVWDGSTWTTPTKLFAVAELYPEYPKIVVHEGNQLHVAWFTREGSVWEQDVPREVWYSKSQSTAPRQPVTPWPTPTAIPVPTATLSPVPTVVPSPVVNLENTGLPDDLQTDHDDVYRLAIALSPVVLIILVVMAIKSGWFGKLRH